MRSRRELYVSALDILLTGTMARVVKSGDWELLREVARLAQDDAPTDLSVTDPALFRSLRSAVTRYHLRGWTNMTPARVEKLMNEEKAGAAPLLAAR